MSTPNYITVSLKNAELTTENGISIAGISKQFKSIQAICGFLMLTGIMIGGDIKSPITAPV